MKSALQNSSNIISGGIFFVLLMMFFTTCDDMHDKQPEWILPAEGGHDRLFILSEGLFNMNNSTLAFFNGSTGELSTDLFGKINRRGLGDTANDLAIYGGKMYIVVTVSSQVEVTDLRTGFSLHRIPFFDENAQARQPRRIVFHEDKAYVSSFDGTVTRIDTTTLQAEATVNCGSNPDGLAVAKGKLYVANSGGLNFPIYDNTVSVVDLRTFTEISRITVGLNPTLIQADSEGDLYLLSNGNYGGEPARLQKISSHTDKLTATYDFLQPVNFSIHNDTARLINLQQTTGSFSIRLFDCRADTLITADFITDGTTLITPYGIDVHPRTGDLYLTDVHSYTVRGDLLCFDRTGKLKFRINEVGLNPKKVVGW